MARWYQLGLLVWALGFVLGCADAARPSSSPPPAFAGPLSGVEVVLAAPVAEALGADPARRAAAVLRQTALDWLEDAGRLDPDASHRLEVTLDAVHLRGAATTWLFAWAVGPDHLAGRVGVLGPDAPPVFAVRVESALAGRDWRDPDERLERLARRLGRRVAEGVAGGL